MASILQPSLAGGEISPSSYARVDLARYLTSLRQCRNFIIRPTGGAMNRSGSEFIVWVKDSTKKVRQIPFQFSTTQTYNLVFGDFNMRVIKDGGLVLNANKVITATTNATPVVVTSAAHGYSNGQEVFISGTGIVSLDNHYWILANITANTFELVDSTSPGSTSATGTVARVFELVTPYVVADLPLLKFTQQADVMTITHSNYRQQQLSRTAHDVWTIADFNFKEGPFQEINVDKMKAVDISAVTIGTGRTIISTHAIFAAANVGQLFYLEQKDFGKPWEVGKSVNKGDIRRADGRYYIARSAGTTGTLRPTQASVGDTESDGNVTWEFLHSGFGVAKITAYTDPFTVTAEILTRVPDPLTGTSKDVTGAVNNGSGAIRITVNTHGYSDDDSIMIYGVGGTVEANGMWSIDVISTNTFDLKNSTFTNAYTSGGKAIAAGSHKWAFGAWGGDQGWPGAVAYHQQRQFFASTPQAPTKNWGSGTDSYNFFGKSVPLQPDDAVSFRAAGDQVDMIRHLAVLDKLILFTGGSSELAPLHTRKRTEWIISGGDNDAIAPNAIFGKKQGPDTLLFLDDKNQVIRNLGFQFASDSYTGENLSVLASHLFQGHKIVSWAFQETPFSCAWMVRDDGVLLGMTHLPEQQVLAFHHHDTKNGVVEDVNVISEGKEDSVYIIVQRGAKRCAERFRSRLYTNILDAFFVDSGVTYDGRNTGSTSMILSGGSTWSYQTEQFTLTSSAPHFVASDVGNEIHVKDALGRTLRLHIIAFTSTTVVTVTANRDVPIELQTIAFLLWGHAKTNFIGANHLEGVSVSILADAEVVANGHDDPQIIVTSGAFSIPNPAVVVHVGIPIEADLETLSLNVSNQPALLVNQKDVSAVRLFVEESRGIFAGSDAKHLVEYKGRSNELLDDPVKPLTDIVTIRIPSTWDKGGRVFVRQSDPLPLSVLAVAPDGVVGGSA